jgi:hypothetical protein
MRNAIEHKKGLKEGEKSVINTDTTFNLIEEGWALGAIGTRNTRRVNGQMVGEFMPFCYMLSRTERGELVKNMFTDLRRGLQKFEDFYLVWDLVFLDHKDGTITALSEVEQMEGEVMILYCYYCLYLQLLLLSAFIGALETDFGICGVHIEREVIQHYLPKFVDTAYVATAKSHVSLLRNDTGSQIQMNEFAKHMLIEWRRVGENEVAKTFEQEYCTPPYNRWGVNSFPEVRGNPPENQPMESEHRSQKRNNFGVGHRVRTRLSFFITQQIYVLLGNKEETHANRSIDCHSSTLETGWPREMLLKAKELLHTMSDTTSTGDVK